MASSSSCWGDAQAAGAGLPADPPIAHPSTHLVELLQEGYLHLQGWGMHYSLLTNITDEHCTGARMLNRGATRPVLKLAAFKEAGAASEEAQAAV